MDRYIDISLLPDPEFPAPLLMNALFGKLHRSLAGPPGGAVGVSFPEVGSRGLGQVLRLHGTATVLNHLAATDWLAGMRDHLTVAPVAAVPPEARHRVVRRVQAKSNPDRLRRRLMARKGLDADQAREAIPDEAAELLHLPYLTLASRSTGQRFRPFIQHRPLQDQAVPGVFSAYGLSPVATVPWF